MAYPTIKRYLIYICEPSQALGKECDTVIERARRHGIGGFPTLRCWQANGGEDVFVHQSEIHAEGFRSLGEGEEVEFAIEKDADFVIVVPSADATTLSSNCEALIKHAKTNLVICKK